MLCATELCPGAMENSCTATTLLPPPWRSLWEQQCRKGVQFLPTYLPFVVVEVKFSYVHKVKMGESEKISLFSKRNLLVLTSLCLNIRYSYLNADGRWHCCTGKRFPLPARLKSMVYFSSVILCRIPSLGPGDQVGNVAFPQS